jgi:hypothetical protein
VTIPGAVGPSATITLPPPTLGPKGVWEARCSRRILLAGTLSRLPLLSLAVHGHLFSDENTEEREEGRVWMARSAVRCRRASFDGRVSWQRVPLQAITSTPKAERGALAGYLHVKSRYLELSRPLPVQEERSRPAEAELQPTPAAMASTVIQQHGYVKTERAEIRSGPEPRPVEVLVEKAEATSRCQDMKQVDWAPEHFLPPALTFRAPSNEESPEANHTQVESPVQDLPSSGSVADDEERLSARIAQAVAKALAPLLLAGTNSHLAVLPRDNVYEHPFPPSPISAQATTPPRPPEPHATFPSVVQTSSSLDFPSDALQTAQSISHVLASIESHDSASMGKTSVQVRRSLNRGPVRPTPPSPGMLPVVAPRPGVLLSGSVEIRPPPSEPPQQPVPASGPKNRYASLRRSVPRGRASSDRISRIREILRSGQQRTLLDADEPPPSEPPLASPAPDKLPSEETAPMMVQSTGRQQPAAVAVPAPTEEVVEEEGVLAELPAATTSLPQGGILPHQAVVEDEIDSSSSSEDLQGGDAPPADFPESYEASYGDDLFEQDDVQEESGLEAPEIPQTPPRAQPSSPQYSDHDDWEQVTPEFHQVAKPQGYKSRALPRVVQQTDDAHTDSSESPSVQERASPSSSGRADGRALTQNASMISPADPSLLLSSSLSDSSEPFNSGFPYTTRSSREARQPPGVVVFPTAQPHTTSARSPRTFEFEAAAKQMFSTAGISGAPRVAPPAAGSSRAARTSAGLEVRHLRSLSVGDTAGALSSANESHSSVDGGDLIERSEAPVGHTGTSDGETTTPLSTTTENATTAFQSPPTFRISAPTHTADLSGSMDDALDGKDVTDVPVSAIHPQPLYALGRPTLDVETLTPSAVEAPESLAISSVVDASLDSRLTSGD